MGSAISAFFSSIDFKKDFDEALIGVEIDKGKLTKENFADSIFAAIWDNPKYPKKKNKSDFDSVIEELKNITYKFGEKIEKTPEKEEELILFIVESSAKLQNIIEYLKKSKKLAANAPPNYSISSPPINKNPVVPKAPSNPSRSLFNRFSEGFKPIMDMYGLKNSNLTEDTFAKVIIGKINLQTQDTNEAKIENLKSFLKSIYSKIGQSPPYNKNNNGRRLGASSDFKQDMKDWINNKKDAYKKEIFDAIEALKPQPLAPAISAPESPVVVLPAVAGGSRKKSKKLSAVQQSVGGSRKKSKKSSAVQQSVGGSRKKSKKSVS